MMQMVKLSVAFGSLFLSLLLGFTRVQASEDDGAIWAGYKAKLVCSGVFVSGRKLADVLKYDVAAWDYPTRVDSVKRQVEVQWMGKTIQAVYRGRQLGCTLLPNGKAEGESNASLGSSSRSQELSRRSSSSLWPEGETDAINSLTVGSKARLEAFLQKEFSEENPDHPKRNTRAIVIVHKGRIVGERYAEEIGIHRETPLIGWSLTKSITNALTGILVGEKRLNLDAPVGFAGWRGDERNDGRNKITLEHLLQMGSGLDFHEDDTTERVSDVTRMLFLNDDTTQYMFNRKLAYTPGTKFNYSTGDSILISAAIKQSFQSDKEYVAFPWHALFDKIGMTSATFEQDTAGTFLGGTNLFATARDWARFGLLFQRDGVWNNKRVLPDGWVDYTRASAPFAAREGKYYGAHFWLVDPDLAREKGIPLDTYLAAGFMGQAIFIVPSMDLVVVRMGWTEEADYKPYDILQALSQLKIEYR